LVCVVCSELESEFSSLQKEFSSAWGIRGRSSEVYWRRGIRCWSLGRSWKFCWVLSTTLTPALGLRLLLSSSSADTSPTRVTVGRAARPLAGAAPRSTPIPPTCRYPAEPRPQLVSLPGCGGPNKTPGFYFRLCVCLRVWRRLLSRTASVFISDHCEFFLVYSTISLALCPSYCK